MVELPCLQALRQRPMEIVLRDDRDARSRQAFIAQVLAWRQVFAERGLRAGDHAAILLDNQLAYYEVLLGALISGIWVTPVNTHLTPAEIDYVLTDSGSRLLVSHRRLQAQWPATPIPVLDVEQFAPSGRRTAAVERLCADFNSHASQPSGGTLMYTSGTTGRPKGVKRASPGNVGETLHAWAGMGRAIGLDGRGAHLVTGPVYHAAPGLYALYDLLNGASVVLMARWSAEHCLQLIERYRITHTHLVPTMFVRLLREPAIDRRRYRLSSLSLVLHGAAPIAPEVKRQMIEWWGDVLVEYWGASESGVITRVDSVAWRDHPGTVGRPLPQYEISVRDDAFAALPTGEVGTLYARRRDNPRPFTYYNDAEKTAAAYHDDWFTLGDMGWIDDQGYVYLADRRSNLIISGGVNIYPAEVENALLMHPEVVDVAVVGVDDPEWGKRVHALVQLRHPVEDPAAMEATLLAFLQPHLAAFKRPRSMEFVAALPRTDAGKLYRQRLTRA